MSNEQKANAIADFLSIDVETLHKKSCYLGAIEMAKWKDEQFNKILDETYEMRKEICRSNVSFADCTELIQRIRKKLEE